MLVLAGCGETGSAVESVDYATVPANGGECALIEDISLVTRDVDGFFEHRLTLVAPSTVSIRHTRADGSLVYDCTFRAPACDSPDLPDFSDIHALLAHPEVVALIEGGQGNFGWHGESLTVGDVTFPQHACSGSFAPPCMPPAAVELQALVKSFGDLHTCEGLGE